MRKYLSANVEQGISLEVQPNIEGKNFVIDTIEFPAIYNIQSSFGSSFTVESGPTETKIIPDGYYTISRLESTIETLLKTIDITFTFSIDENTKIATVSRTGNFKITFNDKLPLYLGFYGTNYSGANIYSGHAPINLRPYNGYLVKFNGVPLLNQEKLTDGTTYHLYCPLSPKYYQSVGDYTSYKIEPEELKTNISISSYQSLSEIGINFLLLFNDNTTIEPNFENQRIFLRISYL